MAAGDNQEEKKNLSGGFGLFMVAALLAVMWMQSFFETKMANVAFSYQIEHLVNLELLQPQDSQKIVSSGSFVTISGRFVDELSDNSRQRFHYLDLIDQVHTLEQNAQQEQKEVAALRAQALKAADLYMHLAGNPLPPLGLAIYADADLSPPTEASLILTQLTPSTLPNLAEMTHRLQTSASHADQLSTYVSDLIRWMSALASADLGIATETMKQQLRTTLTSLQSIGSMQETQKAIPVLQTALTTARDVLSKLDELHEGWRFNQLRSVRDLKEHLARLDMIQTKLVQVQAQLAKQRSLVKGVIWFYNNRELSGASLEKQDSDEYNQWFSRAKLEWDRFDVNKGLPFQSKDQPLTLALERTFPSEEAPVNYFGLLFTFMPVLLIAALVYFMFARQAKGVAGGAMTFGKSPARLLQKGTHKITFKDVAGIEEAKEELQEIVDFLKNPGKFTSLGAEIPKGVLCVGPPGTGKTLIAKAVAGEADRPFFSISGSDFVEMFVGVGASRIRDMFKEAKKQAPCIIFMDEIDAVGRHRGVGIGGGHDEREQTLNQLLVEMDGFEANEGIILMAATNRPDVLDKALLRPGRFDRRVTIDLPDIKGRYEILNLHARKIKMADEVDLMKCARATPGSSGADLKNILNEAALRAVHQGHDRVTTEDVDYAADKIRFGKERRSFEMTKEEIKRTAYHEAGHAIVALSSKHCDPVEKVTVIPRGMALGATYTLPKGNRVGYWKEELGDILAMLLGGRAAEEVFIHDMSSGAQSDIQRATHLSRSMICEWGMSEQLGQIAYDERSEAGQYLGGGQANSRPYSEKTALLIDEEVRLLVQTAHKRACDLMHQHKEQVELMAQMLIEFETLDAQDVKDIMELKFDRAAKEKRIRDEPKGELKPADTPLDRDPSKEIHGEANDQNTRNQEPPKDSPVA